MSRKPKRHYVRAATIALVRDPVSGVLVMSQGGDLGANAKARIKAGEIEVVNREVSKTGLVLTRGAQVKAPGRVEEVVNSGACDPEGPLSEAERAEARKRVLDAAYWLRLLLEQARTRRRTTALYQTAGDRGPAEMSDSQARARAQLTQVGRAIGWAYLSALMDAIAFEDRLSARQEALVAKALLALADWRK